MYKYETHLHTSPVSRCARVNVKENLEFYKESGYDGVFITNHFIGGSIGIDYNKPYEEQVNFYFSDYESALEIGKTLGIKVFCGVEMTYGGTDFLIYGLDKAWFLAHPDIMEIKIRDRLKLMADSGALIIQAHPFFEASYIDHIRLFPRDVHGVEVVNATRSDEVNDMAKIYAEHYNLLKFAGSDNHRGKNKDKLAGIMCNEPILDVVDFIEKFKNGKTDIFTIVNK